MKQKLAVIGASYLQEPLIQKAKMMGCETHVFAWAAGDVGEKSADFFYPISIVEKEKILEQCRRIGINGICSIASDLAMLTVNYVAQELGLVGNSLEATYLSTNKSAMRAAFAAAGDPSPKSRLAISANELADLGMEYPLIVKPTDRSGSRGVALAENLEELQDAFETACAISFEKKVVVEEFVKGQEYSVECVSWQGKHHFLAVTQKYTSGPPHFIETAHLEPAMLAESDLCSIRNVVFHALDTLKIKNGASHSEVKISPDGTIKIIEIGGRMGGDCIGSDLVYLSTGMDYVKMVVDIACGKAPDFTRLEEPHKAEIRFLLEASDLKELQYIQQQQPHRIYRIGGLDLQLLGKTTDSSTRAGCYILVDPLE